MQMASSPWGEMRQQIYNKGQASCLAKNISIKIKLLEYKTQF